MVRRASSSLVVFALAAGAFGCTTSRPGSVFPDAAAALDRMKASVGCGNGVQAEAKIDNFSPQGRVRGDLLLMAVVPDRVRFDVVSFGNTLYTLTSDGDRFQMLDVKERRFLYGPASACNLARLTQVPIPSHALVSLLRGEAPVLVHEASATTLSWDSGGFYKVVIQSKNQATEEIHLEVRPEDTNKPWAEQRVRVTEVAVNQAGRDLYRAELRNFEHIATSPPREDPDGLEPPIAPSGPVCEAEIPRSIRMRVPNTDQDVVVQYKAAKWNPPIVTGAFMQKPSGGLTPSFVSCGK